MNIENIFKETELFRGISSLSRKEISKHCTIRSVSRNEIIFIEGEKGSSFYQLAKGSVKLYKSSSDGREIIVRLMKPYEMFAETILFEDDLYPVSGVAVEDSQLIVIPRSSFIKLLDQPEFRNEFISSLMQRLRYLTGHILYLTTYDVEEKFFRFLLEHYGRKYTYEINISKKDLASAIGTIPETLSRLILRLKQRGIIKWEDSTLNIKEGYWEEAFYEE